MKTLIAAFLGALIAFAWSAVVHMSPVGMMGLSTLNEKEDPIVSLLKTNKTHEGLFFFPGVDMKNMTKADEAAWTAKLKEGPRGLLLYHVGGANPMEPMQLVIEFASTFFSAIIAALILSATVGKCFCRATMVMMMGVFAWSAINVSMWNWWGFPLHFILVDLIDQTIGWFLAGLLMAKMIKPAQPTAT